MRRKPTAEESSEPKALVEKAKSEPVPEKARRITKCTVCGDDVAPNSVEGLCWVCRRLKISAWRDSDPQVTATE